MIMFIIHGTPAGLNVTVEELWPGTVNQAHTYTTCGTTEWGGRKKTRERGDMSCRGREESGRVRPVLQDEGDDSKHVVKHPYTSRGRATSAAHAGGEAL